LTRNYTPNQLRMYRDQWFELCKQKALQAAGIEVDIRAMPRDWVLTFGVNTDDLLQSTDLPICAPRYYPLLCDWLRKDLEIRLSKRVSAVEYLEDERIGESLSIRFRFKWDPSKERVDLESDMGWWELLELLPYDQAYPSEFRV